MLTGGYRPEAAVLDAIRRADLFATLVPEDTYQVASELHDLLVKTHPADAGKIAEIKALLWEYLFIDRVLEVAEDGPAGLTASMQRSCTRRPPAARCR